MKILSYRLSMTFLLLAAPAAALAAAGAGAGVAQQLGIAAVVLWLAGLGWGFQNMLQHRLEAEDRLAQLESDMACERAARLDQLNHTRQGISMLETKWRHLQACLRNGHPETVQDGMQAVEHALLLLQQAA